MLAGAAGRRSSAAHASIQERMAVELSYCVVSHERRRLLRYCLDAIARERASVPFATEVLVLDNASADGSAEAARAHPATTDVIAQRAPASRGANAAALLERAEGRFCMFLDDDSELEPGATAALHEALAERPRAGAACATLVLPDGTTRPNGRRWWPPARGERISRVRTCRSAAVLVRRDAATAVGSFDPHLGDGAAEADFWRRLRRAGWQLLLVPDARAVEHG
jgi:N-acetylglucosaminyl-diphospho-decaprenol L-rhamnosyltransferase